MVTKTAAKEIAVQLRKDGRSYTEILAQVPVAKSTLSLWLRSVGLSKRQVQTLTQKRLDAARRGAAARKADRLARTAAIYSQAELEIGAVTSRELWLMGVMLYWAEGSKEKDARPGSGVVFTNSDPAMLKLFLFWLTSFCKIDLSRIKFEIYLHTTHSAQTDIVRKFWIKELGLNFDAQIPIYFKPGKIKTARNNIGTTYHGLVRIKARSSSELQRRIVGWTRGICKYYWGVV